MTIKELNCPPYCETITVVVCKDFKKAFKKMKIAHGSDVDNYGAWTCTPPHSKKITLILHRNASAGLIAHEAVHIANYIFKIIHASLDVDNDECYAYLLGWIVDGITTVVKRKNKL